MASQHIREQQVKLLGHVLRIKNGDPMAVYHQHGNSAWSSFGLTQHNTRIAAFTYTSGVLAGIPPIIIMILMGLADYSGLPLRLVDRVVHESRMQRITNAENYTNKDTSCMGFRCFVVWQMGSSK